MAGQVEKGPERGIGEGDEAIGFKDGEGAGKPVADFHQGIMGRKRRVDGRRIMPDGGVFVRGTLCQILHDTYTHNCNR